MITYVILPGNTVRAPSRALGFDDTVLRASEKLIQISLPSPMSAHDITPLGERRTRRRRAPCGLTDVDPTWRYSGNPYRLKCPQSTCRASENATPHPGVLCAGARTHTCTRMHAHSHRHAHAHMCTHAHTCLHASTHAHILAMLLEN